MLILLIYIVMFLALSGLLALIDAAVLSVSMAETEEMVVQEKAGAVALKTVKKKITQAVVVIVIVTNSINVLGPILVGQKATSLYDNSVIGIITAVLTFGTIIFSEIIPKSLGTHYAPIISRTAAPAVLTLTYVLFPLVYILEKIAAFFQRGERRIGTETQIRSLVAIGLKAGRIEEDEGQMIHQAFVLNDLTAEDIMTPIDRVISLPLNTKVSEAAKVVFAHEFSRYPVYGENIDDIKGMVLSRQVLAALANGHDEDTIESLLQKTPRIKPSKHSDTLLMMFRQRQTHLATVHKEGKTLGLVTLEDVLEELVGEIEDEKDNPAERDMES
ncbi:MAG: HlyC/CorC family transporter [Planctomycetaceae bacterium]|nr:HlyC/CorC family transporter [Planctomycetaceae bacterium]